VGSNAPVAPSASPSTTPTPAPGPGTLDAAGAKPTTLQVLEAKPPPADGMYVAEGIVVDVYVCHCPPGAHCKCPPASVTMTNDAADSAAWTIRLRGVGDPEKTFTKGSRVRVLIQVDVGEPFVVGAGK
jgi:hypothetical protein